MKTSRYLQALAVFGWIIGREGGKHVLLTNQFFSPERPCALSRDQMRRIDPECAENTAKKLGLVWNLDGGVRANPNHPYYERYKQAGVI